MGDLRLALALYERSLALSIFEAPNYRNLLHVVALHCELGDEARAYAAAEELRCALDLDLGRESCFSGEDNPQPNPRAESCADRMCGELYLAYYEAPSAEQLRLAEELETDLIATLNGCAANEDVLHEIGAQKIGATLLVNGLGSDG